MQQGRIQLSCDAAGGRPGGLKLGDWTLELFADANNLFDKAYAANIRINAFGGRYFEPAPERNGYAGLRLRYWFGR